MAAQSGHGTLQKETPRLCKVIVLISAASAAILWLILTRESWYGRTFRDGIGTEAWLGSCGISLRQGRRAQVIHDHDTQSTFGITHERYSQLFLKQRKEPSREVLVEA